VLPGDEPCHAYAGYDGSIALTKDERDEEGFLTINLAGKEGYVTSALSAWLVTYPDVVDADGAVKAGDLDSLESSDESSGMSSSAASSVSSSSSSASSASSSDDRSSDEQGADGSRSSSRIRSARRSAKRKVDADAEEMELYEEEGESEEADDSEEEDEGGRRSGWGGGGRGGGGDDDVTLDNSIKYHASRYRGVAWNGRGWYVRVMFNGKSTPVGVFEDETEAAAAYDETKRSLQPDVKGKWLNFPDGSPPSSFSSSSSTTRGGGRGRGYRAKGSGGKARGKAAQHTLPAAKRKRGVRQVQYSAVEQKATFDYDVISDDYDDHEADRAATKRFSRLVGY
jgi:hypothetical protein